MEAKPCAANCELFGRFASYFESHVVPLWGGVYDSLVTRSGVGPGLEVLDVGTGTGEVALRVGKIVGTGGLSVGVDAEEEMLKIAKGKAESRGLSNVLFERMSVEKLEIPESTFDSVPGNYSLCCCYDYKAALSECLRVLRPGGRLTYNHSALGDPVEFQLAFDTFEKYKTKRPSERLAEFRKANEAQKEAVEKYRDSSITLGLMRSVGFTGAEAAITKRVIKYKDAGAFLDRILGFNWRNEAEEIPEASLQNSGQTLLKP